MKRAGARADRATATFAAASDRDATLVEALRYR